jgi:hypothetical protein
MAQTYEIVGGTNFLKKSAYNRGPRSIEARSIEVWLYNHFSFVSFTESLKRIFYMRIRYWLFVLLLGHLLHVEEVNF